MKFSFETARTSFFITLLNKSSAHCYICTTFLYIFQKCNYGTGVKRIYSMELN